MSRHWSERQWRILMKLLAEQMMVVSTLKEMLGKNFLGLVRGVVPRTVALQAIRQSRIRRKEGP